MLFQWWCILKFCWWNEYFIVFCKCVAWNNAGSFFPCMFFKNSKQQWAFDFNVADPSNSLPGILNKLLLKHPSECCSYSKSITWRFSTFVFLKGKKQSIGNAFLFVRDIDFIVSLNSFSKVLVICLLKTKKNPANSFEVFF